MYLVTLHSKKKKLRNGCYKLETIDQIKHSRLQASSNSGQLEPRFASGQKETHVIDCGFCLLPPSAVVKAADRIIFVL